MKAPIRVQRKRTKGWRMPENTVYVGRPSAFGNPFVIGQTYKTEENGPAIGWGEALKYMTGPLIKIETRTQAVEMYEAYLKRCPIPDDMINELKGKNLACFCPLDKPCHADVLLKIANS